MASPSYPPKPAPGERIAVISPSTGLPGLLPLPYELGLERLRKEYGLEPVEYPATRKMGSTPQERADDIHAAFADPTIKSVIASIGGDDQITVLPLLDRELIRANPKPFFGYSDNTNLLAYLWNAGIVGYHGGSVMCELGRPGALDPLTAEYAPAERRGLWSSFPQIGPSLGFMLANGVMLVLSATLSDAQFAGWGWRVPFWAAGVLAAAGLWLRGSLAESPRFLELRDHAPVPLAEVVRGHWRLVVLTGGGLSIRYAVFYAVTTWALAYGVEQLGVSRTVMLACIMAAVVVKGSLTPLVTLLGGRYGRRSLCLAGCVGAALWMFPLIALLSTGEPLLMFLGFLVALIAFITMFAVIAAYLPELYEPRVRCTGAAVGYNLGGVLGGALTPIVATAVASGERVPWGVATYLTGIALLSLGCFALLPETRPVPRLAVAQATE